MSSEIRITDPTQMQMFMEEESRMLMDMVEKIHEAGANVLLCQKGIDDIAQHYLAKSGILAVRRVKESDMTKLAKATGGRVTTNIDDLQADDLGAADTVYQKKVESDKWVFVEGCRNPQSVTILIRGGSQRVVDEVDRSIHDALMVVRDVIEKPAVVAGGGSAEAYIAAQLKVWADTFDGREQLAIAQYAESLETIPLTIAENAGMDPIDTLASLRQKQGQGLKTTGIDARNTKVADMAKIDVIEPVAVKEQIIKSATEAACMILRIDDVIAVSGDSPGGGGGGGPPRPVHVAGARLAAPHWRILSALAHSLRTGAFSPHWRILSALAHSLRTGAFSPHWRILSALGSSTSAVAASASAPCRRARAGIRRGYY